MWRVLNNVRQLGYRRPGLVLGDYEGRRSAHAYVSVFLGWTHVVTGAAPEIPVLHLTQVEEEPFLAWFRQHKPDVLIYAHHFNTLGEFDRILRRHRIRAPEDVGIAAVTQLLEGTRFSGLQGNPHLVGSWAVELLVSRIMNRDFGYPSHPRIEMVEMQWIEGKTLRPQAG
jgi:LacI family transcriptional regulator